MSEWEKVNSIEPDDVNIAKKTVQIMNDEDEWTPIQSFEHPAIPQSGEESIPGMLLRNATRFGSRALEASIGAPKGLTDIAEGLYGMIPEKIRNEGIISKALPGGELAGKALGTAWNIGSSLLPSGEQVHKAIASVLPEGYTEPQGGLEDFSDDLAHEVPYLAAAAIGGGLPALAWAGGKALASNVAAQGVKALGGGPGAQFVSRLATSFGTDLFRHKLSGKNFTKFAEVKQGKNYREADKPAKGIFFHGRKLERSAEPIYKEAAGPASKLDTWAQNRVKKEARNVKNLVEQSTPDKWVVLDPNTGTARKIPGKINPKEGQVNLNKAIKQKRHLNSRIKSLSSTANKAQENENEINYYKRLVGTVNEQIEPLEKQYPEFGIPYRKAENITTILGDVKEMQQTMLDAYKESSNIPGIGKYVKELLKSPFWIFQRQPSRAIFQFIKRDPETFQQYAGSLINSALEGDKPGVLRNIELINRMMT